MFGNFRRLLHPLRRETIPEYHHQCGDSGFPFAAGTTAPRLPLLKLYSLFMGNFIFLYTSEHQSKNPLLD